MKNILYPYLDEVEGTESLEFVSKENSKTFDRFKSLPKFKELQDTLTPIYSSPDRIAWGSQIKDHVYNFWQDEKNQKGIWRRTTLLDYQKKSPNWEVLLDLDKLSTNEGENWDWAGASLLPGDYTLGLVYLSRGGKDATVIREFNLVTKEFVTNGFIIPEAKNSATWIDKDNIYLGTDFGPGSLTESGYARVIKKLSRGQDLKDATEVFSVNPTDMSAGVHISRQESGNYTFFTKQISFYEEETYLKNDTSNFMIPMPKSADLKTLFKKQLLYLLKEDLNTSNNSFKTGELVSLSLESLKSPDPLSSIKLVFSPSDTIHFSGICSTKDYLLLEVVDTIISKIKKIDLINDSWLVEDFWSSDGVVSVADTSRYSNSIYLTTSDFLNPTTMYVVDVKDKSYKELRRSKEIFDSSQMQASLKWSKSLDGTLIPYFIVHKKDLALDGTNPTLLYAYGGFQVIMQPSYLGSLGKTWIEKGGVYVLANIRGGGEFGPKWHQAGLKENRHKVFEDFISVAEDLISSKVTSSKHLGIQGGSNGGLLVATVTTMRPDLFNAVLCQVPLIDMLNYHTLLAGASWMDEYGDPRDPKMLEVLKTYSPLQKLQKDIKYPEILLMTSTKDDRVHPSHARKMVKRLQDLGHPVLYYENTNGGHGGSSTIEESVTWSCLELTYLFNKLT